MGGGDCLTDTLLMCATIALRLSDVPGGVRSSEAVVMEGDNGALADGVRLCLVRYDAERGSTGRVATTGLPFTEVVPWKDDRRLVSGDDGAEDAGERWAGGV